MRESVEGLLDSRPRAGRDSDNAAIATCISIYSSSFIGATVLDISQKATAVKERVAVSLMDCIAVHKTHVFPAKTFTANVCKLYGRCHAGAALVRRLII